MKISLNPRLSIEKNAEKYYNSAKKNKRKIKGAENTLERFRKELKNIINKKEDFLEKKKKEKQQKEEENQKKKWYEKFRWFISSDNFLCIGGKDATTNDILIRKHLEKEDLVFHTDIRGSPFFIIKANNKKIPQRTKQETAQMTASYSRAWKLEHSQTEVYCIKSDQVKKELGLPKGSFMIHGKREYFKPNLEITLENKDNQIVIATKKSKNQITIIPGSTKKAIIVKKIKSKINGKLDEIQSLVPGDSEIK